MQTHFVTVVDVAAKLYQISATQRGSTLAKNLGGPVLLETVLLDQPTADARLFDVATTFRDQSFENGFGFTMNAVIAPSSVTVCSLNARMGIVLLSKN